MVRRGGTFKSADGSFFVGRRGWLTVGRRPFWFLIVNDWLYWFKEEHASVTATAAGLAGLLSSFLGHVLMARCNVVSRRPCELEVVQPVGPPTVLQTESQRNCEEWLLSLAEISVAGFPLPSRLDPDAAHVVKEDWVAVRDGEKMFARLTESSLVLARDEQGTSVFRSFQLDGATVAKGKKNGQAAFVIADCSEKLVVALHNPGAAQEWVDALRGAIVVAYASRFEPESLSTLRNPKKQSLPSLPPASVL